MFLCFVKRCKIFCVNRANPLSWYGCPDWNTDPHSTFIGQNQNTPTFVGDGKGKGRGWKASGVPKKKKKLSKF